MGDECIARFDLGRMSSRLAEQACVRTGAIDDEIVVFESTQFFLEPVYVLQEISVGGMSTHPAIPARTYSLTRSNTRDHRWGPYPSQT